MDSERAEVRRVLTYVCTACKCTRIRDNWSDPEWMVAQVRPCPQCGTAMTVTREITNG